MIFSPKLKSLVEREVLRFLFRTGIAGLKDIGLYGEGDWTVGWTTGCMGIDPYCLTYMAEQFGYYSQIILAGRRINDDMGKYIAEQTVKQLIAADKTFDNCAETVCTNQMVQQPVAQTACFSSRKLSKN